MSGSASISVGRLGGEEQAQEGHGEVSRQQHSYNLRQRHPARTMARMSVLSCPDLHTLLHLGTGQEHGEGDSGTGVTALPGISESPVARPGPEACGYAAGSLLAICIPPTGPGAPREGHVTPGVETAAMSAGDVPNLVLVDQAQVAGPLQACLVQGGPGRRMVT